MMGGDSVVMSSGGMIDSSSFLENRSSRNGDSGSPSRRTNTTRRRPSYPSGNIVERTDDGRLIVTFLDDVLNTKIESVEERSVLASFGDTQIGSPTAQQDLQVKWYDYVRNRALNEKPTAMIFHGDNLQGRNYPAFDKESQMTGAMSIDTQERIDERLLRGSWGDWTAREAASLLIADLIAGNHELNSGYSKVTGYSYLNNRRSVLREILASAGVNRDERDALVKVTQSYVTPDGGYASGDVSLNYFNDFGVMFRHYLLERGGKGSGDFAPLQADALMKGTTSLFKNVDFFGFGHFHSMQWARVGHKVAACMGDTAILSHYESMRAYEAQPMGAMLHFGGNKPLQLEYVGRRALTEYKIQKGDFTPEKLKEEGYKDDPDYNPARASLWLPRRIGRLSALQKKIRDINEDESARLEGMVEFK